MSPEELLDAMYFTGPFSVTGRAVHLIIPVGVLIVLYPLPET